MGAVVLGDICLGRHGLLFKVLLAVVCVEIHLLYLAHERVSRVCTGALVVECVLGHLVESVEEVFLVNAVVFDCLLYSDALLELVDSFYKILKLLLVVIAAESKAVGNLCVA